MQLSLPAKTIWLFQKPLDFRCGKNSMLALISKEQKNPTEGVYLFLNKRGDKLKGLCWHHNGFLVLWKELERGRFSLSAKKETHSIVLTEDECAWLIGGLAWESMSQWGTHSFQKFC